MVPKNFDAQYYISNPPVKFRKKIINENYCKLGKRKFTENHYGDYSNLKKRKITENEDREDNELHESFTSEDHCNSGESKSIKEIPEDEEIYELYIRDTSKIRKQFERVIEIMKSGKKWEGDPDFVEEKPTFKIRSRHLQKSQFLNSESESESDSESNSKDGNIIEVDKSDLAKTAFLKYRNNTRFFKK